MLTNKCKCTAGISSQRFPLVHSLDLLGWELRKYNPIHYDWPVRPKLSRPTADGKADLGL